MSEKAMGTVEGETHAHMAWYLKYRNNDWKKERAVVLYKKIKNGEKVCATCTGYVRGKQNSGVVCTRNNRKFQGQGQTAPGINDYG